MDSHMSIFTALMPPNHWLPAPGWSGELEQGSYEVNDLLGVDEVKGTVYLEANKGDDRQEQVFAVALAGGEAVPVTRQPGVHSVSMTGDTQYFVDTYSALGGTAKMQICAVAGSCTEVWTSHTWDGYDTLVPQFVDFKAEDGQTVARRASAAACRERDGSQRQGSADPESLRRPARTGGARQRPHHRRL